MSQNLTFYISPNFLSSLGIHVGGDHVNCDPTFPVYESDQRNPPQTDFIYLNISRERIKSI